MSSLMSRLFSSTSPKQPSPHSQTFSLHTSPKDKNLTLVHPTSRPTDAPPLYSLTYSKTTKPNVVIFEGAPSPSSNNTTTTTTTTTTIGDARFKSLSSTTSLTLRGQQIRLKQSHLTDDFALECLPLGTWKWKVNKLTGSSMKLCDTNRGNEVVAELKSIGTFRVAEKRLEILVPCDSFFVELVLLSAVTANEVTKATDSAILHVFEAAAGM